MTTQTERIEVEAVLRLALEALEKAEESVRMFERMGMRLGLSDTDLRMDKETIFKPAITAIKEALMSLFDGAQPEQEPVAKYSDVVSDGGLDPRNTTPPQRTWVGLTDEQISIIATQSHEGISPHDDTLRFARAIEAATALRVAHD